MKLYCGDCLDVLPTLDAESVDTVITDPPYGLDFMGKDWDHGVPGVPFWEAALRVAKPGAILLAFGGTRTHHRLMSAIEDAGWELRDCMMWLYGSGFPKSHDVSKGIDKAKGAKGKYGDYKTPAHAHLKEKSSSHHLGFARPWQDDPEKRDHNCRKYLPSDTIAQQWNGYGTALKPAWEPIIVAMKPLEGTFAANAEKWGVAGLNIDGGRIPTNDSLGGGMVSKGRPKSSEGWDRPWMHNKEVTEKKKVKSKHKVAKAEALGRWPTNLILDEKAGALLDEQIGDASRFFYCAKASRKERTVGGKVDNNHPTVKPIALMEYLCKLTATPTGGVVLDPFMGSGTTGIAATRLGREFVGIERSGDSFRIAEARLATDLPLVAGT